MTETITAADFQRSDLKRRAKSQNFDGESKIALLLKHAGLKPVPQYQFDPERKYRADFAFPDRNLLIEFEGGLWARGGHSTGQGILQDIQKHNHAQRLGWHVLRFTKELVLEPGYLVGIVQECLGRF